MFISPMGMKNISILLSFLVSTTAQGGHPRMSIFDLKPFKYETWEIMLPKDWIEQGNDPKKVYLESGDNSKGMYFMSVSHPDPKSQSAEGTLKILIEGQQHGLNSMQGHHWLLLGKPRKTVTNGVIRYSADHYDQAKRYFIRTLIFVQAGIAARFTFHDYNCTDPEMAKAFLEIPIRSIQVVGLAP